MVLCFYKSVPINSFLIVRGLKFKASLINGNNILDNCITEYINSKRINSNTNSKKVYVFCFPCLFTKLQVTFHTRLI